jgi:adenylate kinase family enzyme
VARDAEVSAPTGRLAVVGATGSGQTRLAQSLARKLSVPHVELEALYWEAGGTEASRETGQWLTCLE